MYSSTFATRLETKLTFFGMNHQDVEVSQLVSISLYMQLCYSILLTQSLKLILNFIQIYVVLPICKSSPFCLVCINNSRKKVTNIDNKPLPDGITMNDKYQEVPKELASYYPL